MSNIIKKNRKKDEVQSFVIRFFNYPNMRNTLSRIAKINDISVNQLILNTLDTMIRSEQKMYDLKKIKETDKWIFGKLSKMIFIVCLISLIIPAIAFYNLIKYNLDVWVAPLWFRILCFIYVIPIGIMAMSWLYKLLIQMYYTQLKQIIKIIEQYDITLLNPQSMKPENCLEAIPTKKGNIYKFKKGNTKESCFQFDENTQNIISVREYNLILSKEDYAILY